eukprot:2819500-Amphidinium_carterae.2
MPNAHYAQLRPETALPGVGNDEDFGSIFESAATIDCNPQKELATSEDDSHCNHSQAYTSRRVKVLAMGAKICVPSERNYHEQEAVSHLQDIRCVITSGPGSGHVGDDRLCRPGESLDTKWWKQAKTEGARALEEHNRKRLRGGQEQ